ncbi:hypothetical protein CEE69_31425 [Rhodopirellula bahusiensis]|uniref:Uncharacterized protein n=1 Tax=Rhodopirellula bahusiensis TaxID=2014065 RepID=A0A2G1VX75_9BACT|nr:hypothetical protein CEE69_31425 [Rhodopirellula bahusiensis]
MTTQLETPYRESPDWFVYELHADGRGVECFVNDRRIYATDSVQIFYSIDDHPPRLLIVPWNEYPKHVVISPDTIWRLYIDTISG